MKIKKFESLTMPLGMIGVIFYLLHTLLGQLLWPDYNPISTDISSLTAVGAPNRTLLLIFTTIYGIATILFVIGMLVKSFRKYHSAVRTGWGIFLLMNLVSIFGYALFPLTGDKTQMTFGNMMHIIVTVIVVFTTITAGFVLSVGYLKQEKMKRLGTFTIIMSVIITTAGVLNPIGMINNLNIMGLTERAVIYSLQLMMFVFSAYYSFSKTEKR
ncbi:uncharacterized protein DUF998 [Lacrimispora xylanisolvens]|uniref:Uncharacterized protein DUF998 n=1 Tax=Lacrimispora xylanisolvens TaxID=384636 RepID=A0A2S6HS82_9FIRM|nr:DUF998 domain-containing protein [Hungatella xylanolytica]PPK80542.1 uncharacterized protein DUF998 [Hungatella xylanolytica]